MRDNFLVSVVIPTYNSELLVCRAIKSVLSQTCQDVEVIVVDDFSSDGTVAVVKKTFVHDRRVRLIELNQNGGAGRARNEGITVSKGRFLSFLDSDDEWHPCFVESILLEAKARDFKSPVLFSGYERRAAGGRSVAVKGCYGPHSYNDQLTNTLIATSAVMIDRDIADEIYFDKRRTGQDYALWLRLLRQYGEAYCLPEVLVTVHVQSNSLSSNKFQSVIDVYQVQRLEGISQFKVCANLSMYLLRIFCRRLGL